MIEVGIPLLGWDYLMIAESYVHQTRKTKRDRFRLGLHILFFSVVAAEAFANQEGDEYMSDQELTDFIRWRRSWGKKFTQYDSSLSKKWAFLMGKVSLDKNLTSALIEDLDKVMKARNELVHFKPRENTTKKHLVPKKRKVLGPEGKLYTSFRKTGFRMIRSGILHTFNLTQARHYYRHIDDLILAYYSDKHSWPISGKDANDHWGKKSPFWEHRKQYKEHAKTVSEGRNRS